MCGRAQVLEVLHCHQKAPVPVLRGGPVMSSQIVSAEAAAYGHPLSGDIPYLLLLYDGSPLLLRLILPLCYYCIKGDHKT